MIRTTGAMCFCLAFFSTALRAEEVKLNGAGIDAVLTEQVVTAANNTSQIFRNGGVTFYLEGSSSSQGLWKVDGDKYCSQWPPHVNWDCYDVLRDGKKVTFLSAGGKRFSPPLPRSSPLGIWQ